MDRTKTYGLAFGTAMCAFGIGYIMQFGLGLPGTGAPAAPIEVTAITDTAAPKPAPRLDPPADTADAGGTSDVVPAVAPAAETDINEDHAAAEPAPAPLHLAAFQAAPGQALAPQATTAAPDPRCDVTMTAEPLAGAMVRLALDAPCHASERVTLHHNGMMITEVTDGQGALVTEIPALVESAVFIAAFADDAGAVARADVSSLPFYDRVVLQWDGAGGLELHAREFGAAYFDEGHVWTEAPGSIAAAAQGQGGFLSILGNSDVAEPRLAQVYSFPSGTAQRAGDVALSVEAEIRDTSCGRDISAQTMVLSEGRIGAARDLILAMPGCDSTGDFLVLNNLIEDLKIAAR